MCISADSAHGTRLSQRAHTHITWSSRSAGKSLYLLSIPASANLEGGFSRPRSSSRRPIPAPGGEGDGGGLVTAGSIAPGGDGGGEGGGGEGGGEGGGGEGGGEGGGKGGDGERVPFWQTARYGPEHVPIHQ